MHHGGSGTAASVAARIPTFVCSLVADNPFWGPCRRVGIGVHERFADLKKDRLETGLRRALHTEVITRSRTIGDTVRVDTWAAGRAADSSRASCPTDRLRAGSLPSAARAIRPIGMIRSLNAAPSFERKHGCMRLSQLARRRYHHSSVPQPNAEARRAPAEIHISVSASKSFSATRYPVRHSAPPTPF